MRHSQGSIKREYSHLTENWEVPQDDSRLMRRLKRRFIASEMMERNYSANAKRKKVGSCGHEAAKNAENSGHVLVEEVDEDYGFFLDKVDFHADVVSDNNIIASDVDVNTCHDSDDDGDTDAQYKSRMGPCKGTIKQEYSHLTENWEVFQYDSRLMRRLKRRSIASEIVERHYSSNAKRKKVGSFGDEVVKNAENSGNVLEEEVDLDKVDFHVDVIGDDNIIASDINVNTSHDSDNDGDTDAQYKMLLENLWEDDKSYILKVFVDNQLFCVRYEGQEVRFHDLVNSEVQCEGDDEDYQLFLNSSRMVGHNLVCMPKGALTIKYGGSESEGKSSKVSNNLQDPFEVTGLSNSIQASGDYHVAKNKRRSEVLSDVADEDWQIYLNSEVRKNSGEKHSAVRKNFQIFNEATEPPKARKVSDVYHVYKHNNEVQCGIGEDYQLFLNSSRLDGDSLICMPERDITIKYGASKSEGERSKSRQNLQVPFEVTELPNSRQALDDFHVAKKKRLSEVLSDGVDEDLRIYLNSVVRKNAEEKPSAVRKNLQVSDEATGTPNAGQASDDYRVARNKRPSEVLSDVDEEWQIYLNSEAMRKSEAKHSAVRQNLQVSNEATELPNGGKASDDHRVVKNKHPSEVLSDVDEDWQIYLNSEARRKSEAKSAAVRQNLQVSNEATELPNAGQASDDYRMVKNKRPSEVLSDVDEDWQIYLDSEARKNAKEKPSAIRQNLQVSNEATGTPNASDDYRVARNKRPSEVLSDVDEDWQIYLNSEGRRKSEGKHSAVRQNLQVSNEATELPNSGKASDDHRVVKNKHPSEVLSDVDEDWQLYLNSEGRRKSEAKRSAVRQNLQVSNEATELSNAGQASDDHRVVKNKYSCEVLSDVDEDWQIYLNSEARRKSEAKSAAVRQNLKVSNKATELRNARQDLSASQCSYVAKHKCNTKVLCNSMDENYQLFLKSLRTDGNNLIYMPENGVAVVYGEECDQSSTDSEPIILQPSQHCEDSPSICSESYRSFCLADERNYKDSLYRKGLLEELERPYNQKELDKLLQIASHERPKELHREMRHGVTKDRPKGGDDNKTSYLKMHGGLQNAINQVKESHKVLFLLRGFFYWLKHVPQGGAFRPWLDASCLKMLQKL